MKVLLNTLLILAVLLLGQHHAVAQVSFSIGTGNTFAIDGKQTIALDGDWLNSGKFLPDSGTVIFNGSTDQTIFSNGDESFYNLWVENSGGSLILKSTVIITNNLSLISGSVDNTGYSLVLEDGASLTEGEGTIAQPPITLGQVVLWPPNHQYKTITTASVFSAKASITSVTSDEPENLEGDGDGNTSDDIEISDDCQSVKLRNERDGYGNGRVYTVFVRLDDGTSDLFRVIVPHDSGSTTVAMDAVAYTVDSNCNLNTTASLGKHSSSFEDLIQTSLPEEYSLAQNYPNPFNPTTTIRFDLPKDTMVRLDLFNVLGQKIATLLKEKRKAGYHQIQLDARDLPSGVYIYAIRAGNYSQIRKMILMK